MGKKKNGKANGKTEFSKRNKSLLGYNSIFTPDVTVSYTHLTLPTTPYV